MLQGIKQYTAISAIASYLAIVLVLATADIALSMADSQKQATLAPKKLTEAQIAKMDSNQLAHYIFQNHGCKNCHTLKKGLKD